MPKHPRATHSAGRGDGTRTRMSHYCDHRLSGGCLTNSASLGRCPSRGHPPRVPNAGTMSTGFARVKGQRRAAITPSRPPSVALAHTSASAGGFALARCCASLPSARAHFASTATPCPRKAARTPTQARRHTCVRRTSVAPLGVRRVGRSEGGAPRRTQATTAGARRPKSAPARGTRSRVRRLHRARPPGGRLPAVAAAPPSRPRWTLHRPRG